MKAALNRIAALLGYVPRSEVVADIGALLALLGATQGPAAASAQFATTDLVADQTPGLIFAELCKHTTLLEVLAKQGDITVAARSTACADLCSVVRPATGAAASGLPG